MFKKNSKNNQLELIKAIKANGYAVSVMDLKGNKNGFLLCEVSNKKEKKLNA